MPICIYITAFNATKHGSESKQHNLEPSLSVLSLLVQEITETYSLFCVCCSDLDIFVEMHRLIVNVVLHEVIINARQQGHLRQREDVHELFHTVSMGTLQTTGHGVRKHVRKVGQDSVIFSDNSLESLESRIWNYFRFSVTKCVQEIDHAQT